MATASTTTSSSAAAAGLFTVWIKRGPWGYIAYQPGSANLELDTPEQLPSELKSYQTP